MGTMKLPLLLLLLLFNITAFTQTTVVVSGTVTDAATGKPILGVWVRARATYYATATNPDGFFQLRAKPKGIVVISQGNYKTQRIKLKGRREIEIKLVANPGKEVPKTPLDSSQKPAPIQTQLVTNETFNGGMVTHPLQALTGKIPGLIISKQGSNSEQSPTALIRGLGTLLIGSEPLCVVDDIPSVPIDQIPVEEIESVEAVRGAAASVYGVRGANGVLVIKTKKSNTQSPSVHYRSWVGVETLARQPDLLNAEEFRGLAKLSGDFTDNGAATDWVAAATRPAFSTNHYLALGKHTESFSVRASFGYLKQQGNVQSVDNERINARIKGEQTLLKGKLTLGFQLSVSVFNRQLSPDSMFAYHLRSMRPTDPILNPDGTYFEQPDVFVSTNPVGHLKNTTHFSKRLDGLGNLFLKYQFNRSFSFKLNSALRTQNETTGYYQGHGTRAQERGVFDQVYRQGEARRENRTHRERFLETSVRFQKSFKNHDINGTAGYAFQERENEGFWARNNRFITDDLSFNNLGAGTGISLTSPSAYDNNHWVGSSHDKSRLLSFFGQLNYTYHQTYFVHLMLRRDGNSKFADGQKWGTFPSVSAGWHLSELAFLSHRRFFQTLTLRANYGITGNSEGLVPLRSQELVGQLPQLPYYDGLSNTYKPSYGVVQLSNPTLQWEETRSRGWGVDFAFFKNRLRGSLDGYDRQSSGVLWPTNAPFRYANSYFQQTILLNTGAIQNKGLELALEAEVIHRNDFKWKLNWTGAWNKNRLISMNDNEIKAQNSDKIILFTPFYSTLRSTYGLPTNVLRAELPVGTFWGPKIKGTDKNGFFIYSNNPFDFPESESLGSPQPNFTMGLTNQLSYKRWHLSFLWNGRFGHQLFDMNRVFMVQQSNRLPYENALREVLTTPVKDSRTSFNDYWIENGNFLRLDNLTLHYEFKTRPQIKRMKAFLGANNLLLLTRYSGIDPEMDLGNIRGGVHYLQFFYKSRGFNAGFEVEF